MVVASATRRKHLKYLTVSPRCRRLLSCANCGSVDYSHSWARAGVGAQFLIGLEIGKMGKRTGRSGGTR